MSKARSSAVLMHGNSSAAVMQQRAEPNDSLDYFPTPPWATRALCEWLLGRGMIDGAGEVWEPACGQGHMAAPLGEYFSKVYASDVHQYGDNIVSDFLFRGSDADVVPFGGLSAVITNPPFAVAEDFIRRGLELAPLVAMLVRTSFIESDGRYERLYSQRPPAAVLQFVSRVVMLKGRLVQASTVDWYGTFYKRLLGEAKMKGGIKPDEVSRASSATSYCWMVFTDEDEPDTRLRWLTDREALERDGDYPEQDQDAMRAWAEADFAKRAA